MGRVVDSVEVVVTLEEVAKGEDKVEVIEEEGIEEVEVVDLDIIPLKVTAGSQEQVIIHTMNGIV